MNQFRALDGEITALIEAGVPGVIIDVRNNPGGLSQISDALASRFFAEPQLIGTSLSPDGRKVYLSRVDPRGPIFTGEVAVLVDLNTASAGDLFAYTFKITGRGVIVGNTPSAGMAGTVSGGRYALPGEAFIQVPTGGFVDAEGEIALEGVGAVPDVVVPVTVESVLSPEDEVLQAAEESLREPQRG
jgi:carboxyl-terminal processing protease